MKTLNHYGYTTSYFKKKVNRLGLICEEPNHTIQSLCRKIQASFPPCAHAYPSTQKKRSSLNTKAHLLLEVAQEIYSLLESEPSFRTEHETSLQALKDVVHTAEALLSSPKPIVES